MIVISVLTMFIAGMGANQEVDFKKVIALSTLRQLGVMIFSLSLGFPLLALFHLYTHALFKALLFICAGSFIFVFSHRQDVRGLGGVCSNLPISSIVVVVANLALCGFPFLAGFYSKDLILESSSFFGINWFMYVLVLLSTGLTVSYSVRFCFLVLWDNKKFIPFYFNMEEKSFFFGPMIFLFLGALFSGSLISWFLFDHLELIYLSLPGKMVVLFVTFVGFYLGFYFFESSSVFFRGFLFIDFNIHMWFLEHLRTRGLVSFPFSFSLKSFLILDQG